MKKSFAKLGVLTMAAVMSLSVFGGCSNSADLSGFVSVDINPSVEFVTDKEGKVAEVRAVNQDGKILISGMALVGKDIEVAVELITDEAEALGFITDNNKDISITVGGGDGSIEKTLRERAEKGVKKACDYVEITKDRITTEIETAVTEFKKDPAYQNLNAAKLRIINSIMEFDRNFTVLDGANMSMAQLVDILEDYMDEFEDMFDDKLEIVFEQAYNQALNAAIGLDLILDQIYGAGYAAKSAMLRELELLEERFEAAIGETEIRFHYGRDFDDDDAEDFTVLAEIDADLVAELAVLVNDETQMNAIVNLGDLDDYIDNLEDELEEIVERAEGTLNQIAKEVRDSLNEILETAKEAGRAAVKAVIGTVRSEYENLKEQLREQHAQATKPA